MNPNTKTKDLFQWCALALTLLLGGCTYYEYGPNLTPPGRLVVVRSAEELERVRRGVLAADPGVATRWYVVAAAGVPDLDQVNYPKNPFGGKALSRSLKYYFYRVDPTLVSLGDRMVRLDFDPRTERLVRVYSNVDGIPSTPGNAEE